MKGFIAFLVCIIAASGVKAGQETSDHEKRIIEMVKEASKACSQEMKIDSRYIMEDGTTNHLDLNVKACHQACIDKKIGVVNKDGTYNLERIITFADTPELKQKVEEAYSKIIKECAPVSKDPCKMAACVHGVPPDAFDN